MLKLTTLAAFFCTVGLNSFPQARPQNGVEKTVDETLVLRSDFLKEKPFVRKGLLYLFKRKSEKRCEINLNLRLSILETAGTKIVTIDNIKGSSNPMTERYQSKDFIAENIDTFLIRAIKQFTNSNTCDECVLNFASYYSQSIFTKDKSLFTVFNMNAPGTISFVTLNPLDGIPPVFPEGAAPGGTFVVTANTAVIPDGATLYLPQNFTIKVDPGIVQLDWTFSKILFDDGATIDLSQRENVLVKLPTPAANNDPFYSRVCPGPCRSEIVTRADGIKNVNSDGAAGINGQRGACGVDGKYFSLKTNYLSPTGNLWIRTDGQDGQDGQDGGDGGWGARGDCNGTFSHGLNGGKGGSGGIGGEGGAGGSTAFAMLQFLDVNGTPIRVYNSTTGGSYLPSQRPAELNADHSGLIIIYGNPGRSGAGGRGGKAGDYGHGCTCGCGSTNRADDGDHAAAKTHYDDFNIAGIPGIVNNVLLRINKTN